MTPEGRAERERLRARLAEYQRLVIDAAALAAPEPEDAGRGPWGCLCQTLHHRMTGDGCAICNPEYDNGDEH